MTDASKPWENENAPGTTPAPPPPPPAPDLDALKAKADELGVQYAANIGAETLATRVAEAEAAAAGANDDADKPEPTVVTPPQDIDAQKRDEKVSKAERQPPKGSIDWSAQAPLEIVNMVSAGMSLKDARKKYEKSRAAEKARAEAKAASEAEEAEE